MSTITGLAALPDRSAVVLIDGRSGSGKTTLAGRIAAAFTAGAGAAQLHLEDLYPGWDGLAAGSQAVAGALRDLEYRRYDWRTGAFAEQVRLDPSRPLVIEGCGAVTAENLRAAAEFVGSGGGRSPRSVWSIWLECPAPLRRERALARDGDVFAPHWASWAAQEDARFAAEHPIALADRIIHVG